MTRRSRNSSAGDCAVGYGKPPTRTRFRKGVSGNPGGRPRGITAGRATASRSAMPPPAPPSGTASRSIAWTKSIRARWAGPLPLASAGISGTHGSADLSAGWRPRVDSPARNFEGYARKAANPAASLCSMIFQYPKFGLGAVQRLVAFPWRPVRIRSQSLGVDGRGANSLTGSRGLSAAEKSRRMTERFWPVRHPQYKAVSSCEDPQPEKLSPFVYSRTARHRRGGVK
jgi:hypothetical protein